MVDLNCILTKAALPGHSTLPVTPGVILIFIFFFFLILIYSTKKNCSRGFFFFFDFFIYCFLEKIGLDISYESSAW